MPRPPEILDRLFQLSARGTSVRIEVAGRVACASSVFAAQGVATVRGPIAVHDFANVGVRLMPSTAPQFDASMTALIPNWSEIAAASKPYLVILSNHSERTIVAYCVSFEMTDTARRVQQSLVHFNSFIEPSPPLH